MTLTIPIAGGDTGTPRNLAKRLRLIRAAVPQGSRLLDAGCGSGEYVNALHDYRAFGVEYLTQKLRPGLTRGDIQYLPYGDNAFDAVIMNEVLEHVPDEMLALREVWRVLRPNGQLLLFSPNRFYPFETHGVDRNGRRVSPLRTLGYPYLPLAIATRIANPWARNYWPRELRSLLRGAGFVITGHRYVWQTFENISGTQPALLRKAAPILRKVAAFCEHSPLRIFGTSQLVIAAKH